MITSQLNKIGVVTNSWTTLDKFSTIVLHIDSYLFPVPAESQYYFDTTNELVFVRYTFPTPYKTQVNENFVAVTLPNIGDCYLQLIQGGVNDARTNGIGRYHEVFSFESLTSFQ